MSHGDGVVNMSVAVRDHVLMVQTAQNTVEVSQVHHTGRIADMQRQETTIDTAQSDATTYVQRGRSAVPEIVDIPVPVRVISPWSSNTSHCLEHQTDEVSEKSIVMTSGPDAGENPLARVNGVITDLIPDEG